MLFIGLSVIWLKKVNIATTVIICDNTFPEGNVKVRDCLITGKYGGASQRDFNVNVSLNYKNPHCDLQSKKYIMHILLCKNLENLILRQI